MTKKDYIIIADAIAQGAVMAVKEGEAAGTSASTLKASISIATATIAQCIADGLKAENPRFDQEKFAEYIASKIN